MAIVFSLIAIISVLVFWLRLSNIEKYLQKHTHRRKRALRKRFIQQPVTKIRTKVAVTKTPKTLATSPKQQTQIYTKASHIVPTKQALKRASRWRWFLAVLIASITGMAIAFVQWGSSFISPEYIALIWFGIGIFLVFSAAYAL